MLGIIRFEWFRSQKEGFRSAPIGLASYQKSFGLHFVDESAAHASADHDARVRVLVSGHRYGMRWDLAGKKVALVGNAPIENCGSLIDRCDEVIRVSTMRNWRQSQAHDGLRVTTWAGHPWLMVSRTASGDLEANARFAVLLEQGVKLWAASPFHISFDSYRWLSRHGYLDRLVVAPSPADVFEIACSRLEAEDLQQMFSLPGPIKNIVGLNHFDLLLTGTRLAVLLELCGVNNLNIFGTNLFNFSRDGVWIGHDLKMDYKVLMGVKRRISSKGGNFYWNEERKIQDMWREIE